MVKHIVMWRVGGDSKEETILEMVKHLESLRANVPVLREIEVGVNQKESPAAFDVVITTAFDSWDDLKSYAVHPYHAEVAGYIKSVTTDRCVVDYEV